MGIHEADAAVANEKFPQEKVGFSRRLDRNIQLTFYNGLSMVPLNRLGVAFSAASFCR